MSNVMVGAYAVIAVWCMAVLVLWLTMRLAKARSDAAYWRALALQSRTVAQRALKVLEAEDR